MIADGTFGPGWWGIAVAGYTAGVLVGTALMARLAFRRPLLAGVLGVLGHGPLLGVLAAGPHPAVLAGAAVAAGLGLGVFNAARGTALQRHVPPARLSRVAAYDALGTYLALPDGQLTAGYLAAAGQPRAVVTAAAVLATAATLAMLANPRRAPAGRRARGPLRRRAWQLGSARPSGLAALSTEPFRVRRCDCVIACQAVRPHGGTYAVPAGPFI